MANLPFTFKLPRHAGIQYYNLRTITSKIQRTASIIGFIHKSLYNEVTPTFAKVTSNFTNIQDKKRAEVNIFKITS